MSNKQRLDIANTKFEEQLIKMINELEEKTPPEGQYVWKKYGDVPFEIIRQGTTSNPVIFNVTCESVDLSTVDLSWFDGATGTYDYGSGLGTFEIKNGSMYMDGSLRGTLTYNASAKQLTLAATVGSTQGWVCDKHKIFIDYVVSDDETAYPDGGEQNGYWYERAIEGLPADECITPEMFGFTKMSVNTMVYSGTFSVNDLPISHSLNDIPKMIIIRPKTELKFTQTNELSFVFGRANAGSTSNNLYVHMWYQTKASAGTESLMTGGAAFSISNVSTTRFNLPKTSNFNSFYWSPGVEYEVITFA
jgi:hypothetical protein